MKTIVIAWYKRGYNVYEDSQEQEDQYKTVTRLWFDVPISSGTTKEELVTTYFRQLDDLLQVIRNTGGVLNSTQSILWRSNITALQNVGALVSDEFNGVQTIKTDEPDAMEKILAGLRSLGR